MSLTGKMARVGRSIRGFGEYHIGSNSIMSGGMSPPMITNSVVNGGVIIRHREYLRDIPAATNFTNYVFPLNPGISSTFPWLSQIATSFEQYRFRGIVFEFKSTSADNVLSSASSTALGTVVMGTKYNVLDGPFTNKFEMENWEFTTSCKPSLTCMHPIECAKSQTPQTMLYVRPGNVTETGSVPNGDLRLYDLANFNIAVLGMQNSGEGMIGELWCTYEVEFFKPKLEEDVNTHFAHFDVINGQTLGNPNTNYPFGTNNSGIAGYRFRPSPATNSSLPVEIVADVANAGSAFGRLYINDCIAKRLLIQISWLWGAGIIPISNFNELIFSEANSVGLEPVTAFTSDLLYQYAATQLAPANPVNTTAISRYMYTIIVEVTSDVAYMVFNGGTWTGNGTSNYDVWITELGPNAD